MRSQGGHLWASVFIGYNLNGLWGFVSNRSSITKVPWLHGPLVQRLLRYVTSFKFLYILKAHQNHCPSTLTNSLHSPEGCPYRHLIAFYHFLLWICSPWHAPIQLHSSDKGLLSTGGKDWKNQDVLFPFHLSPLSFKTKPASPWNHARFLYKLQKK